MLDLSDGLAGDAKHLAAASSVALTVALERLPVGAGIRESGIGNESPAVFAARGGEDYELLVTMPPAFDGTAEFRVTRIGEVSAGLGVTFTLDGRPIALAGYDHFA
jgi:thiamine-monophosphate kinase